MSTKVQTAVRLDKQLLEALKEKAKADHRSLNNYIEKLVIPRCWSYSKQGNQSSY